VETTSQGGRAFRRAGLLFLVSCPLMALTADVPIRVAPVLLVVAVCVHSIGEVHGTAEGRHGSMATL
jgi:hypothetical protein